MNLSNPNVGESPPSSSINRMFLLFRLMNNLAGKRDSMGLTAATTPEISQELATLTKVLAEATNMIKLKVGGTLSPLIPFCVLCYVF